MMTLFETTGLVVRPIDFRAAAAFVRKHHRHCRPPVGHKFSLACYDSGRLVGVAICGRPVARRLDDGKTVEINRLATDGTMNACSKLYGAACRWAKKIGAERVITYTLSSENGASLRAANFRLDAENVGGLEWSGKRKHKSAELKNRWVYQIKYDNARISNRPDMAISDFPLCPALPCRPDPVGVGHGHPPADDAPAGHTLPELAHPPQEEFEDEEYEKNHLCNTSSELTPE